ncbi:MAG: DUF4405 domain-containing protein [Dehalococcoidales bacterium]|nr:DUF4405 domain-containing protein [Dehalococcoidales bacterium]
MAKIIKRYVNFLLDVIALLSILVTLVSSYILWFILPMGQGAHGELGSASGYMWCNTDGYGITGNYITVMNWPRYTWIDIHTWASIILLGIIILHIVLHWKWIISLTKRIKNHLGGSIIKVKALEQYAVTVLLLILFTIECLSGFIIWLVLPRGALDFENMLIGLGRTFWGLQRNIWVDIHAWLAIAIIAILIIHILLNWRWILNMTVKKRALLSEKK